MAWKKIKNHTQFKYVPIWQMTTSWASNRKLLDVVNSIFFPSFTQKRNKTKQNIHLERRTRFQEGNCTPEVHGGCYTWFMPMVFLSQSDIRSSLVGVSRRSGSKDSWIHAVCEKGRIIGSVRRPQPIAIACSARGATSGSKRAYKHVSPFFSRSCQYKNSGSTLRQYTHYLIEHWHGKST